MSNKSTGKKIDDLIYNEQWHGALVLIQSEMKKKPDDHWLITRLGEVYYEQGKYKNALDTFLKSKDIVPDCPLTLWHLAGTLDALGYHMGAIQIYTWILKSNKTPKDDACWESLAWTDTLKADSVFRMGLCFEHANRKKSAIQCYRQYANLLLAGVEGSYPIADAQEHIRDLHKPNRKEYLQPIQNVLGLIDGKDRKLEKTPMLNERKIKELQES